jgi:hypothetical protein
MVLETFNAQHSTLNAEGAALEVGSWKLNVER